MSNPSARRISVHDRRTPEELHGLRGDGAERFRDALRANIVGPNDADDLRPAEHVARVRQRRRRSLARIAASPRLARERVPDLETWESLRVVTSDASEEPSGR